jgi:long-subunit fatty acid transport protein
MNKIIFCCLILLSQAVLASNGQVFDGINYINPANNYFVKKFRIAVGSIINSIDTPYKGTLRGVPTKLTSDPTIASPYTRLSYRVNKDLALGLAINEPYRVTIKYALNPDNPNLENIENFRSINYHPNFAVKVFDNLWFGAGLNIVDYRVKLNIITPIIISIVPKALTFKGSDVATSYVLGVLYVFNNKTFLDLAFYSKNVAKIRGYTRFGGQQISTRTPTQMVIPKTIIAAVTHNFNNNWLVRGVWSYSYWSDVKNTGIDLINTRLNIPLNYKNTNRFSIIGKYSFSNGYALSLFASQDFTPTNLAQNNLPLEGDIFSSGIIVSKNITQGIRLRGMIGYAFNLEPLSVTQPLFNSFGQVNNRIVISNIQAVYAIN